MTKTLTVAELAGALKVSQSSILKMVREQQLPHFRFGRRILFKEDQVELWIERLMNNKIETWEGNDERDNKVAIPDGG